MEKTRYWLKLEKDFMTLPEIKIISKKSLESVLLYITMMLESTPQVGHLRLSDDVPYDEELISEAFGFDLDVVASSLELYKKLGLMKTLPDGTLFMTKVPSMTGKESESAQRVRDYRKKKKDNSLSENDSTSSEEEKILPTDELIDLDSVVLQCNENVTECNKIVSDVTKSNDNIEKQSKYTTTEYIEIINNVEDKLINRINSSCSCCLEENETGLKIVFNWVMRFKDKILRIVNRAIEIVMLKDDVSNKVLYINGILKRWYIAGCRNIDDVDKYLNYSIEEVTSSEPVSYIELEIDSDYNWLTDDEVLT